MGRMVVGDKSTSIQIVPGPGRGWDRVGLTLYILGQSFRPIQRFTSNCETGLLRDGESVKGVGGGQAGSLPQTTE